MNIGWKLVAGGLSTAAGAAANAAVNQVWHKGLKRPKVGRGKNSGASIVDVVVFTAVTTLVSAVVASALKKKTDEWYGR